MSEADSIPDPDTDTDTADHDDDSTTDVDVDVDSADFPPGAVVDVSLLERLTRFQ